MELELTEPARWEQDFLIALFIFDHANLLLDYPLLGALPGRAAHEHFRHLPVVQLTTKPTVLLWVQSGPLR